MLAQLLIALSVGTFSEGDVIFRTYPGFVTPAAEVQMITNRGLMTEILLKCDSQNGRVLEGIMTYSTIEGLFCSSKNRCYGDVEIAASETCGW